MKHNQQLIDEISDLFFQFQAKLQFYEREYLHKYNITDVTPSEVKVLYIIGLSNQKSMSSIAKELKITPGSLSTTIASLEKKGFVERSRLESDRRVIIVSLTKKCVDVINHYAKFYYALLARLIDSLPSEQSSIVEIVLKELNNIIETDFYEGIDYVKSEIIK